VELFILYIGGIVGGAALIYAVAVAQDTRPRVRAVWVVVGCGMICLSAFGLVGHVISGDDWISAHATETAVMVAALTVVLSVVVLRSTNLLVVVNPFRMVQSPIGGRALQIALPTLDIWGRATRRRLRSDVLSLVVDIRAYLRTVPSPTVASVLEFDETRRMMMAAKDEAERTAIWNRRTHEELARSEAERQVLAERFGGRVQFVIDGFVNLGRLDGSDARLIQWQCQSGYWISQAAARLEGLALAL
jgi:hypothetical protein